MSYLSHLLVVVVPEVQFVSGPSRLGLPSVDIIRICKIGEVCVTVTKHSVKVKQLNQHKKHCSKLASCTWECAAQHLSSQADVTLRSVLVPGLRVDSNVTGHRGSVEKDEDGRLCVLVSFEYLQHKTQPEITAVCEI